MAQKDGNQQFPVAFAEFAAGLKGTADEVWTALLRRLHGREKHTLADWMRVLDAHRDRPVHR